MQEQGCVKDTKNLLLFSKQNSRFLFQMITYGQFEENPWKLKDLTLMPQIEQ